MDFELIIKEEQSGVVSTTKVIIVRDNKVVHTEVFAKKNEALDFIQSMLLKSKV